MDKLSTTVFNEEVLPTIISKYNEYALSRNTEYTTIIKELKQKISDLQSENEQKSADQQRFLATNSILEAEAMIESGDYENAKICLDRVDKNYVEGFAKGKYDKLNQSIKENTEK